MQISIIDKQLKTSIKSSEMEEIREAGKTWNIDGFELTITKPNKLYWPEVAYTKLDLLNYYKVMAPVLLPYFKNRPATIKFFPEGIEGLSYYKRNFDDEIKDRRLFTTVPYSEKSQDKIIQLPIISSTAGILWFASKGGIEFHLWSSKAPKLQFPDIAIFDLDVQDLSHFKDVLKVTNYLGDALSAMKLKSYAKTSGGKGIHVYVPILPHYTYEIIRAWVKSVGDELADKYPDLVTTEKSKSGKTHNQKKVSIDYLQNVISRNTIAPYSVRAYKKAPVSTPLTWDEIREGGFLPTDFTIENVPERVERLGDVFKEVLNQKEILPIPNL